MSVGESDERGPAGLRSEDLGQPEIEHLDLALRRNFDVGRLQVPMDDAFLMSGFEPLGDLLE